MATAAALFSGRASAPARELEPARVPAPAPAPAPAPSPARDLEPARVPASAPSPAREFEPAPTPARASAHGDAGDGDGDGDVDILTLLHMRDQLKGQFMECNTAVLAEKENFLDYPIEENFIQSATEDLQRDLEDVKVSFQNKTLALQRIQITDVLRKKLKQDDEDSRLILETMKHILLLSRTIIEYQEQARQKEQELIDIKRKRLCLPPILSADSSIGICVYADDNEHSEITVHMGKMDIRDIFANKGRSALPALFQLLKNRQQKLQEMQTTMKKEKEKKESVNGVEIQEMLETLEKARETTTILQNVLQSIIFGSAVNWAEDPSLKAVVLQLEKNVYLQ